MAIIRGAKPASNFYILDKSISEDERLSWGERGMLVYLLGKPESWKVSVSHLVNQTKNSNKKVGRDKVYAMLSALEAAGYVTRSDVRGEDGKYGGVDYIVHETPVSGSPVSANPLTANPTQVSIDKPVSTEVNQKPITSIPTEVDQQQPKTEIEQDMFGSDNAKTNDKVCPWEEILDIWAEVMPDKPQPVRGLWPGSKRATDLNNRWKLGFGLRKESNGELFYTDRESGLDWWRRFFHYMRRSDFLMGNTAAVGQRAFTLKIDWVVNKTNFVKIMENTYHR